MDSADHLLSDYVTSGSDTAFAELVKRYVDFVYSLAARRLGAPHHEAIQDVVQTVFVDLAQKAGTLRKENNLGGWLHRHTCFVTSKYLRSEQQRFKRERAATEDLVSGRDPTWSDLMVVIDEAIQLLSATDRAAILMRFFDGKNLKTIGANLGINEDTAQKRVSRAIDRLKDILLNKGIRVSSVALAGLLAAHSIQAVPVGFESVIIENIQRICKAGTPVQTDGIRTPVKVLASGVAAISILFLVLFWPAARTSTTPEAIQDRTLTQNATRPEKVAVIKNAPIPTAADSWKNLSLKVVEQDSNKPISGVMLNLWFRPNLQGNGNVKSITDEQGLAILQIPTEVGNDFYFTIRLAKDGYVDRYVSWSTYQKDALEDVPSEYTATLNHGTNIGGFVRNIEGEPIPGVTVWFSGPSPVGIPPREADTVMSHYHKEFTDSTGRWQCTHAPMEYGRTTFELQHPDYVTSTYAMVKADVLSRSIAIIPPADFLNGSASMTMSHGLALRGQVLNGKGDPVMDAKVIQNMHFSDKQSICLTDGNGVFQFNNCATDSVKLTILAKGFAPFSKEVLPTSDLLPIELTIAASVGLRGAVIDQNGSGISNALVQVAFDDDQRRQDWDWNSKTASNGSFYWDSSPNENIRITFSAPGFQRKTEELQPGKLAARTTLMADDAGVSAYHRIKLKVVNTQTQQPIAGAEVTLREHSTSDVYSPSMPGKTDLEGRLDLKLASDTKFFDLEVRADSFRPESSPSMIVSNAPPEMTIQLTPGNGMIEGWVSLPSGEPVSEAEVGLLTIESSLSIGKRHFLFRNSSITTDTDASGRFSLAAPSQLLSIIVVHSSGFARIKAPEWKNGSKIQLQPFATIRGTFILNGKPRANAEVGLVGTGGMLIFNREVFSAKTDDNGGFTFADVPPDLVKFVWLQPMNHGTAITHDQLVKIEAGIENIINFQVAGRPIRGKLNNRTAVDIDWASIRGILYPKNSLGEISGGEARQTFGINVNSDGTFSSPAIPIGTYQLMVQKVIRPSQIQNANSSSQTTYFVEKDILVPEGPGEIDLGKVDISNQRL